MEGKYYSIDETAEKIGVHAKTIRRYIYGGKLSAQKIGGQWRVYENAIQEYMNDCKGSCGASPSQDDFCVFMDGEYFASEGPIQICTIVDCYIKDATICREIVSTVMALSLEEPFQKESCRIHYLKDKAAERIRFVVWGNTAFIVRVLQIVGPYESKEEKTYAGREDL